MTIIILIAIAIGIAFYLLPNDSKAGAEVTSTTVRGAVKYLHTYHLRGKAQAVANPNIVKDKIDAFNAEVFDTVAFETRATKAKKEARDNFEKVLAESMAELKTK